MMVGAEGDDEDVDGRHLPRGTEVRGQRCQWQASTMRDRW